MAVWFLRMDGSGGEAFRIPGCRWHPDLQPRQQVDRVHQGGAAGVAAAGRRLDAVRADHRRTLQGPDLRLDERALRRPWLPRRSARSSRPRRRKSSSSWRARAARPSTHHPGRQRPPPSWRPDSRALVFTSNMFQRDEYVYERADIFTVELDGLGHAASPTTDSTTRADLGGRRFDRARCANRA